jgi:acyl carrier protein
LTPIEVVADEISAPVNADMVIDELAIDSLEYISMIRRLEQVFSVTIEESQLEQVKSLGDLCRLVDKLRAC